MPNIWATRWRRDPPAVLPGADPHGGLGGEDEEKTEARAGKDEAEVAVARRVAEARFERERSAALIAAAAAREELETVVGEAASRARKECERFSRRASRTRWDRAANAEAKDALIEYEDEDDGDAEDVGEGATARRSRGGAGESGTPLADVMFGGNPAAGRAPTDPGRRVGSGPAVPRQ